MAQVVSHSLPTTGVLSLHLGNSMFVLWWTEWGLSRVAICPVFPGHVLFFRVENSVWAHFFNLAKCPGFL